MTTHLSATAGQLATFDWPSAIAAEQLNTSGSPGQTALIHLLQQALLAFGFDYVRLFLATATPVILNLTPTEVLPADQPQLWFEYRVLQSPSCIMIATGQDLPVPASRYAPAGISTLASMAVLRHDTSVGTLMFGACRPLDISRGHQAAWQQFTQRLGSVLAIATPEIPPVIEVDTSPFFMQVPWAMAALDSSGAIIQVNPATLHLLKRPLIDVIGRTLADFFEMADISPTQPIGAVLLPQPDGPPLLIELNSAQLPSYDNKAITAVSIYDISRDEALIQDRLRTAELEGVFNTIATVNHQINNPLFGLMASAQLLREELPDPTPSVIKKLDRMRDCCERIKKITDLLSQVVRPARRTYAAQEGMLDLTRATQTVVDPPWRPRSKTGNGSPDTQLSPESPLQELS